MRNLYFYILPVLFNTAHVYAKELMETCPLTIETTQQLKSSIKGWEVSNEETRFPLESIRFSEGHPKDIVWLIPDETSNNLHVWKLSDSNEDYWVTCGYANTNILISRKIAPQKTLCTVEYGERDSIMQATHYTCK